MLDTRNIFKTNEITPTFLSLLFFFGIIALHLRWIGHQTDILHEYESTILDVLYCVGYMYEKYDVQLIVYFLIPLAEKNKTKFRPWCDSSSPTPMYSLYNL